MIEPCFSFLYWLLATTQVEALVSPIPRADGRSRRNLSARKVYKQKRRVDRTRSTVAQEMHRFRQQTRRTRP